MSASCPLPLITDLKRTLRNVSSVPKADIAELIDHFVGAVKKGWW
jgi:hypothetical protein